MLEQPALADLLTDAFDRLWDSAEPAPGNRAPYRVHSPPPAP